MATREEAEQVEDKQERDLDVMASFLYHAHQRATAPRAKWDLWYEPPRDLPAPNEPEPLVSDEVRRTWRAIAADYLRHKHPLSPGMLGSLPTTGRVEVVSMRSEALVTLRLPDDTTREVPLSALLHWCSSWGHPPVDGRWMSTDFCVFYDEGDPDLPSHPITGEPFTSRLKPSP